MSVIISQAASAYLPGELVLFGSFRLGTMSRSVREMVEPSHIHDNHAYRNTYSLVRTVGVVPGDEQCVCRDTILIRYTPDVEGTGVHFLVQVEAMLSSDPALATVRYRYVDRRNGSEQPGALRRGQTIYLGDELWSQTLDDGGPRYSLEIADPETYCQRCCTEIGDDVTRLGTGCTRCMVELSDGSALPTSEVTRVRRSYDLSEPEAVISLDAYWRMLDRDQVGTCSHCNGIFDLSVLDADDFITWTVGTDWDEQCNTACPACQPQLQTCGVCDTYFFTGQRHACAFAKVNSYSYKPSPIFHGKGPLFLGLELEMEAGRGWSLQDGVDAVAAVSNKGRVLYMKYDGSVSNGFELVTHPMTCDWAMENFPWKTLDALRANGFRSWNTTSCGMHIHMSRDGFDGEGHILKFLLLAYRASDKLVKLAGRNSRQWASWDSDSDDRALASKAEGGSGSTRYAAVNTENEHTIEMRFWKGSLNPVQVKAALQWCAAAHEYTRDLVDTTYGGALTWDMFCEWVGVNAARFPELALRISERVPGSKILAVVEESIVEAAKESGGTADYDGRVEEDEEDPEDEEEDCDRWDCRYDLGEIDINDEDGDY